MRNLIEKINGEKKLFKKLAVVGLPIALQSLIASTFNLVDNLVVGSLGEEALAIVGLSSQVFFVFWMFMFGFCSGSVTYMAQFFGAKDMASVRKVLGIALTVCFAIGLLFFIPTFFFPNSVIRIFTDIPEIITGGTSYIKIGSVIFLFWGLAFPFTFALRATQQTSIPLKISLITFSVNVVLDIFMVYGFFFFPKFGYMGALYATLISRVLEFFLYIIAVFFLKNIVGGKIKEYFSYKKNLFLKVLKNAIPTTINESLWGFGFTMYNAAFGRISVVAFAAVQAGTTIMNIIAMACFAIGDSMLILVGEQLGAGKKEAAFILAKKLLYIAIFIGIAGGIILLIISKPFLNLFNFTEIGQTYTFYIILINAGFLFIKVFNTGMITGILRSGGDTKFAMFIEGGAVWLLGVPAAFITALFFQLPVYLCVLCVQIEELTKFVILIYRFKSKKWVKTLV